MTDPGATTSEYMDPMVYDVMRETANVLRAEYIARERDARVRGDDAARYRWFEADLALMREVRAVPPLDEAAVRSKIAELAERRRQLPDA